MVLLYVERSPWLTEHPNTQRYHDHGISKQRYQQQEGNKFLSLSYLGKSLKNQAGKLSFSSQFRLTGFVKQVVLLWVQNSFCPLKSDLPTATAVERLIAVSLRERGRINECWICKLSSLGTSVLRWNERIKDCLINRMSSVQSSAYICFSRQWFKFFMLDGTLDFGQMNRCLPYWT